MRKTPTIKLLAGLLGAMALGGAGCGEEEEKPQLFTVGTVLEERVIQLAPQSVAKREITDGKTGTTTTDTSYTHGKKGYVLTIETPHNQEKYYLLVTEGKEGWPVEVLDEAITKGTDIVFQYLREEESPDLWGHLGCLFGTREKKFVSLYPIDRRGVVSADKLHILGPFEDPEEAKKGMNDREWEAYETKREAQRVRALEEARDIYRVNNKPKP